MATSRKPDKAEPNPLRPLAIGEDFAARAQRPPYAIVDIGSNSVRLVVYDQLGRAPMPRFNEKSLCRLGEGLAQTGAIAPENFRRTVEALRRFRAICDAMGVTHIDATATEAMRRASNGPALAAAIEDACGMKVRILTGAEEAGFAALGVISGFFRPVGVVGDMGGGSLEIAEALDDRAGDRWASLPLGALPVEALLGLGLNEARRRIDALLQKDLPPGLAQDAFYAVGGGWRAVAKAHMEMVKAPVQVVHGYTLDAATTRDFAKALQRLPAAKLATLAGVPERRARTLPAAALVLDRVLKHLAPRRVVFSALGLREGFLYSQLDQQERYLDPLVEGADLVGLPAARTPAFAAALASWTGELFPDEPAAQKRLRVAACALSDIAWRDHPDLRAEESYRRLLQFPFIGIDHAERVFLAATIHARYAGRADAPWLNPAIALLSAETRRRAQILGRAMLLAYRFSGGALAVLKSAHLRIAPECLWLEIGAAARAPDSEVVGDRLKLLASALGLRRSEIRVLDPAPLTNPQQ